MAFILSIPSVQTRLAHQLTQSVNEKYKTDIQVDKVDLSYLGRVQLKGVLARDPHKDTIIYIGNLNTSIIEFERLKKGKPKFNLVSLSDVTLQLKTYKGQSHSAFDLFIDKLEGKPTGKPSGFLMQIAKIKLKNAKFRLYDFNKQPEVIEAYDHINGEVYAFKVDGPKVNGNVRNLSLIDHRGLIAEKMETDFFYTKTSMDFKNTFLKTPFSTLRGDIAMRYQEGELSDFNNKVQITADLTQADLAMYDMQKFYTEFGTTDVLHLTTQLKGSLNDFTLENLELFTDENARMEGDYRFINAFDTENGFKLDARITHLESDYQHLKSLLPNLLGKTLPVSFAKLGHFNVNGRAKINIDELDAFINAQTNIGNFSTDLMISNINNIDQSSYDGEIKVQDLKVGSLIGNPLMGDITMDATIVGSGFSIADLDTEIDAKIYNFQYNGYSYSDIAVQGNVNNKMFTGKMQAKDPNLKMTFDGLADLSKDKYVFDFEACVDYANFQKLNLLHRDSIAILKGDVKVDMVGNQLENMVGRIEFRSATYTNEIKDYYFEDFTVVSHAANGVQNIDINSTDIVSGTITGKFLYAELPRLAQNAIGSIYAQYKPYPVSPNQFLDFKFNIYNQAVAVFFPEVELGTNTFIRGEIDADKELFKLTFRSPEVNAFDNKLEKIRLQIDNQNPLFNTQLSLASLKTAQYDIADFNMVNVTLNDTLYFQTEFKGGNELKDHYNLAFYHTITEGNKSVLALQDSQLTFNGTDWNIHPDEDSPNRIIYDPQSKLITYEQFLLTSGGQSISFYGDQKGEHYRNYNIDLDRVQLSEIMPDIPDFDLKGLINGGIWIEKRNNMLIPKADVQVLNFTVNDELQGDIVGEIKGGKNNKEYVVSLSLENGFSKNLLANGRLDFNPKDPMMYMVLNFNNFKITPLNALGKGVMENIRGTVSGEAGINGKITNPVFSGELLTENVGVFFPFINVDYAFENDSKISLQNQSFVLEKVKMFDSLLKTKGEITGNITHQNFKKWRLNLKLETDNLLALHTPETEDALFYGTGFLEGLAFFTGDTDNVNIAINGSSNPGTEIIIPMSDLKTVETSKLIHFKNPDDSEVDQKESIKKQLSDNFKGVTMNFDFDINKNATIKIVIDKASGSYLKGSGRGNILMDIDTKGTFNMYGDYMVNKGIYNFKYGGIINKPFTVKSGGSISFNGDPYKAELDIEAIYTVKANPKVLLPEYNSNKNIPVDLNTKITGELFNSSQEFNISIPNAGVDIASELEFVLNKQDSGNMMRQFVSLLTIGNFFDESNLTNTGAALGNEGITSVAMAVSNALMDIFSDPNDKIQFGFDYTQGNQNIENLRTENQLGVSVSTRLGKNENFIINGEVNVPTGSQANANIAGNVSIEFPPLNKKETLYLRVFNRQNEIQYTDEEEGYTQGMGLSWQIDFERWEELKEKMGLKKNEKPKDSIPNPEKSKDSIKPKDIVLFKEKTTH